MIEEIEKLLQETTRKIGAMGKDDAPTCNSIALAFYTSGLSHTACTMVQYGCDPDHILSYIKDFERKTRKAVRNTVPETPDNVTKFPSP